MRTITSRNIRIESNRALKFLVAQMKKGWTAEEALEQVENGYGHMIYTQVLHDLKHFYGR